MKYTFSEFRGAIGLAGLFALIGSSPLFAEHPASRLTERLDSGRTFALPGTVHPLLASAVDEGEVEPPLVLPRIILYFKKTEAQQADLDRLLEAQQDRSSPQYHQWLTPEQFADRFGLSESDLAQITAWLRQLGFTAVEPARGRTFVAMTGTASQVRLAFKTSIRRYRVQGELHYANSSDPLLPRALEGVVGDITGLNDFYPRPAYTLPQNGSHYIAPGDFAVIYDVQPLYDAGIDGTGQTIAIVGASDIQVSNIEAFQAASGLPVKDPQIIAFGPDPGINAGAQTEAYLDIEWAGAVARGATIVYVDSQSIDTSWTYAIDQNVGQVISVSYGSCEPYAKVATNALFQQANAQGITVVAASGDNGAAACDGNPPASQGLVVLFPASSPNVTGVGGTSFNESGQDYWSASNGSNGDSALSYIPEVAWFLSGGGVSAVFAKPSWQQGAGVPADGFRDVPDLALFAGYPNFT
jgi:subtilase family serine protease